MSDLNYGLADITAAKQKDLDLEYKLSKKNSAAPDPNDPMAGASKTVKHALKREAKPEPVKIDKSTREMLMKKPTDPQVEAKARAKLLGIYEGYYKREELKKYLPKKLPLTTNNTSLEISAALGQVRGTMNSLNAGTNMRKAIPTIVDQVLKLLAQTGVLEQIGLQDALGCAVALEKALGSPGFQTEMAEMEVEYGDWFAASLEIRFLTKMYLFLKAYSQGMRNASRRPSQPTSHQSAAPTPTASE